MVASDVARTSNACGQPANTSCVPLRPTTAFAGTSKKVIPDMSTGRSSVSMHSLLSATSMHRNLIAGLSAPEAPPRIHVSAYGTWRCDTAEPGAQQIAELQKTQKMRICGIHSPPTLTPLFRMCSLYFPLSAAPRADPGRVRARFSRAGPTSAWLRPQLGNLKPESAKVGRSMPSSDRIRAEFEQSWAKFDQHLLSPNSAPSSVETDKIWPNLDQVGKRLVKSATSWSNRPDFGRNRRRTCRQGVELMSGELRISVEFVSAHCRNYVACILPRRAPRSADLPFKASGARDRSFWRHRCEDRTGSNSRIDTASEKTPKTTHLWIVGYKRQFQLHKNGHQNKAP